MDTRDLMSPSLMVYEKGIDENIKETIRISGSTNNLRPHIKTHKSPDIVRKLIRQGITKFKCATVAEAEVLGMEQAVDVLIAYPVISHSIDRVSQLMDLYPNTKFSFLVDDENQIREAGKDAGQKGITYKVYLDINNGMNRTGVADSREAFELYQLASGLDGVTMLGLHVYDGHIHDHDLATRKDQCFKHFASVEDLTESLKEVGFLPKIIAGGTPTFPFHAAYMDRECSPGTFVFWDKGYAESFSDFNYLISAVLITRLISKPGKGLLCLDLGYKSVASEMPHPRVTVVGLEDAEVINHSEEHLVIRSPSAGKYQVGDTLFAVPTHICPTVARYDDFYILRKNGHIEQWPILARKRKISV